MLRTILALTLTLSIGACQTLHIETGRGSNETFRGPNSVQTVPLSFGSYLFRFETTDDFRVLRVASGGISVWDNEIRAVMTRARTPAEQENPQYEFHANGRFYRFRRHDEERNRRQSAATRDSSKRRPSASRFKVLRPDIYVCRPRATHRIREGDVEIIWKNPGLDLFFLERMPTIRQENRLVRASTRWYLGSAIVEVSGDGQVHYRATPQSEPEALRLPVQLELDQAGQRSEPSS